LSGYSLDDLFMQNTLLDSVEEALGDLARLTADLPAAIVAGAPLRAGHRLYNCAVVIAGGRLLGAVPKSYLPTYREFYESRQFASGAMVDWAVQVAGQDVRIARRQLFVLPLPDAVPSPPASSSAPPLGAKADQFTLGIEICEDLWVPLSPGAEAALAGAEVLANLSGSPITVGKARERRALAAAQSAKLICGYVYSAAGAGESSTDLSWDGQTLVFERGELLAKGPRFSLEPVVTLTDLDLAVIRQDRLRQGTFDDNRLAQPGSVAAFTRVEAVIPPPAAAPATAAGSTGGGAHGAPASAAGHPVTSPVPDRAVQPGLSDGALPPGLPDRAVLPGLPDGALPPGLPDGAVPDGAVLPGLPDGAALRPDGPDRATAGRLARTIPRFPFVPDDPARLDQDCYEAYNIQVSALAQRLRAIGQPKVVIGVSGGLDSSHALIVAAKAMGSLGRTASDILAVTMPGFGTSSRTKDNAAKLSHALGVTFEEIDIRPAANLMLRDLKHPFSRGEPVYDIAFENVQAGLRTDYLFRLANQRGGIVLGTGDLSELALGWCTYGVGDQMSHYNVNPGVPKTLIQHLIAWVVASGQFDTAVGETLTAILDTEISPELIPPGATGEIQSTQSTIGPYPLHDFILYHTLRFGLSPRQVFFRLCEAWEDPERGDWPPGVAEADRRGYTPAELLNWMEVFYRRFFAAQFKRSALPNGPKAVRGGALSPRGDWRQPSDASGAIWLAEVARLKGELL
ncbi:MAG: NAD(+) synthase, partial [Bifidobacteriaceae bacterium]|nr:NAD(+) synthase [Bifidobacteriaceae bacterium]